MTSPETPATACPSTWKVRMRPIIHIVFWVVVGALLLRSLTSEKPQQQGLRITNTGSQSVEIRRLARWSWQEDEWMLPHGEIEFEFTDLYARTTSATDEESP